MNLELIEEIKKYLRDMAPHIRNRYSAQLLQRTLVELTEKQDNHKLKKEGL